MRFIAPILSQKSHMHETCGFMTLLVSSWPCFLKAFETDTCVISRNWRPQRSLTVGLKSLHGQWCPYSANCFVDQCDYSGWTVASDTHLITFSCFSVTHMFLLCGECMTFSCATSSWHTAESSRHAGHTELRHECQHLPAWYLTNGCISCWCHMCWFCTYYVHTW